LPVEIRQKIFRLLLDPYYYNYSGICATHLGIHAKNWGCAEQYEGDFEAHLVREAALEAMRLEEGEQPHVMSVEERRDSETTYYQEKKDFLHQKKPHPGRKYQYEIYGVPRKHIRPGEEGPDQDWLMIDLVRNLSNVSTQFREELGTVFWASTSISARFTCGKPLLHFFKEQPAIHQGIKSLFLEFDFWEALTKFDGTALQSLCNYLSSILNLQHLDIDITVYDTDLPRLASGKGRYKALNALRTLKVSKSFEIELCIMCNESFGDDEDARYEHTSKLEDKHMPALRDLMMPDTLRPAPPKTEKEIYLHSRPTSLFKTA
jgi:hypothetical protein